MNIFYKENTGFIGGPKYKSLALDFIVPYQFDINYKIVDGNGNETDSNKTLVYCRFHSSKKIANHTEKELLSTQGFCARAFEYDGIDKTEEELIEWLFNTEGLKPNNGMDISVYGAKVIEDEE